jgi:hypothetical protein
MPSLLDRIQARLELFRLEQRYTRRRNRRSTFVSNAVYVDGEYIYNTPNTTGSSSNTTSSSPSPNTNHNTNAVNARMSEREVAAQAQAQADAEMRAQRAIEEEERREQEKKAARKLNRWSSMPGFGSVGRNTAVGSGLSLEREHQYWSSRRNSAEEAR